MSPHNLGVCGALGVHQLRRLKDIPNLGTREAPGMKN
jgi:hypothetical protein